MYIYKQNNRLARQSSLKEECFHTKQGPWTYDPSGSLFVEAVVERMQILKKLFAGKPSSVKDPIKLTSKSFEWNPSAIAIKFYSLTSLVWIVHVSCHFHW